MVSFDEEWSAFVQVLKRNGNKVIHTHIGQGKDFFEYEPEEYDLIVSNPPYSIKDKVIKRLYELEKPFAMLMPIATIQGKERAKYFVNGVQLLTFDKRICYHNAENMDKVVKGSPFASGYFCKDLLPKDLIVEQLEARDEPLIKNNECK